MGAGVSAGVSIQAVVATILQSTTFTCATLPLYTSLVAQLCGWCSNLKGPKRTVFVLFVGVAFGLCQGFWIFPGRLLFSLAQEDLVAFVFLCLTTVVLFLVTYLVFRRPSGKQRRRRTGAISETQDELAEALRSHSQLMDAAIVRCRNFEQPSMPMCSAVRLRGKAAPQKNTHWVWRQLARVARLRVTDTKRPHICQDARGLPVDKRSA